MRKLMQRSATVEHIIVLGDEVPGGMHSLADMIDNGTPRDVTVPLGATDPALLCFTSGTSAAPKAVLRSYATITGNARIYSPTIELGSSDVVMVAPPFTHVFGLCCVHCTLCHGGTVVLLRQFTPPSYVEMIDRFKPSVVFTAPAHLAACLKAGLFDDVDLSSIREVVIAGSVCPPDVANALEAHLPNGRAGGLFGMTETILITQTPITEGPEVRHYSVGRVTPGIEARVTGDDGTILGADHEGELQVRGYSIMSGYLNNDEANRLAFTDDGWFRTGDLAVLSQTGDVQITGRLKDIINRGGIKINPTDLENLITAHPNVIQCAIVPMPDDVLGEKSCLFVTLVPGTELDLKAVTDYLVEHDIAKMKWPERLEVIDEMPMTPTKKIIKGALQGK
jgi:acyl-CoA synthetase (AMP-forming)/AMP-acid ligase II